jgi:hypothetical protein
MIDLDDFYAQRRSATADLLLAADGWEALAVEQEQSLSWDREALPSMCARKATLYRKIAAELRAKALAKKEPKP